MPEKIGGRIKSIRTELGLTQGVVSCRAGISQAALSSIERSEKMPTAETLFAIANALDVEPSDLMGEKFCPVCGFEYTYEEGLSSYAHKSRHEKAERIIRKYGFFWPYRIRQTEFSAAYSVVSDKAATDQEKYEAAIRIFKALFSRSVISYENDDHPAFDDYVAMMLGSRDYSEILPPNIYNQLLEQYGKQDGIAYGAYYQRPDEPDSQLERVRAKLQNLPSDLLNAIEIICDHADHSTREKPKQAL